MKKAVCAVLCLLLTALCACAPAPGTQEEATPTPAAAQTPSPEPSAIPESTATPGPEETGDALHSSYAYLVSFDPDTGVALFDDFDMLTGGEAVEHLVEYEGYSEADAQSRVDNFADSEFVEKNQSSQLRAIDLDEVALSLMYHSSGAPVENAPPVPSTAGDFRAIYALDPALLLDSFFFYIHADEGGNASLVEQVYWP